jgi:hypothetical protein
VRYGREVSQGGRSCRKTGGSRRSDEPLDVELTEDAAIVRRGRRVVRTLTGADAATARGLIDDPARLAQFIARRTHGSRR